MRSMGIDGELRVDAGGRQLSARYQVVVSEAESRAAGEGPREAGIDGLVSDPADTKRRVLGLLHPRASSRPTGLRVASRRATRVSDGQCESTLEADN